MRSITPNSMVFQGYYYTSQPLHQLRRQQQHFHGPLCERSKGDSEGILQAGPGLP